MFNTSELNDKLVSELREIAKSMGIAQADDLRKQDLITQIENNQTEAPAAEKPKSGRKSRVVEAAPAAVAEAVPEPVVAPAEEPIATEGAGVATLTV